jgi:hypothetical protein
VSGADLRDGEGGGIEHDRGRKARERFSQECLGLAVPQARNEDRERRHAVLRQRRHKRIDGRGRGALHQRAVEDDRGDRACHVETPRHGVECDFADARPVAAGVRQHDRRRRRLAAAKDMVEKRQGASRVLASALDEVAPCQPAPLDR